MSLSLRKVEVSLEYERSVYKTPIVAQATLRKWAPLLIEEVRRLRRALSRARRERDAARLDASKARNP